MFIYWWPGTDFLFFSLSLSVILLLTTFVLETRGCVCV